MLCGRGGRGGDVVSYIRYEEVRKSSRATLRTYYARLTKIKLEVGIGRLYRKRKSGAPCYVQIEARLKFATFLRSVRLLAFLKILLHV
jgi:hypothetical protein